MATTEEGAREGEEEGRAAEEEARILAAGVFLVPPSAAAAAETTEASRPSTLTLPSSNPTATLAEGQWSVTLVGSDGGEAAAAAAAEALANEGERAAAAATAAAAAAARRQRLGLEVGELLHLLEERRCLEHVGQHREAQLRAADVDALELADAAVARRVRHAAQLHVHRVLDGRELPAVELAAAQLERHGVALGLVQQAHARRRRLRRAGARARAGGGGG